MLGDLAPSFLVEIHHWIEIDDRSRSDRRLSDLIAIWYWSPTAHIGEFDESLMHGVEWLACLELVKAEVEVGCTRN